MSVESSAQSTVALTWCINSVISLEARSSPPRCGTHVYSLLSLPPLSAAYIVGNSLNMRIARCIALSFISLTTTTLAAQIPLSTGDPSIASTNLIDALSADPDYTSLIRLLQRARLIPTLNRLNGSTFFAPTNDAIERHRSGSALWHTALDEGVESLKDNIQEQLRQELFYHLLNYTIPAPSKPDPDPEDGLVAEEIQIHKTLHFPRTLVEPPSDDPAPAPPWLPIPGGALGGEPQRVRLASRGEEGAWVGVDAFGLGGVEIIKGRVNVSNGVLLGVDNVLPVPPDLGKHTIY